RIATDRDRSRPLGGPISLDKYVKLRLNFAQICEVRNIDSIGKGTRLPPSTSKSKLIAFLLWKLATKSRCFDWWNLKCQF
ncbi:hypothetical protein QE152_g34071, partial [Popillia japonica]